MNILANKIDFIFWIIDIILIVILLILVSTDGE